MSKKIGTDGNIIYNNVTKKKNTSVGMNNKIFFKLKWPERQTSTNTKVNIAASFWNQSSSSESNFIFVAFGAFASISLKWAP